MGEELIKQSEAQVSGFQRRLRKWSRQSVGSAGNALAPSQEVLVCRARRDSIDAHRKSGRGRVEEGNRCVAVSFEPGRLSGRVISVESITPPGGEARVARSRQRSLA